MPQLLKKTLYGDSLPAIFARALLPLFVSCSKTPDWGAPAAADFRLKVALNRLKHLGREATVAALAARNVSHRLNRLAVAARVDQKLGRLFKRKDQEAEHKHGQREGACGEEHVAPALVAAARAAHNTVRDVVARRQLVRLGKVGRARVARDEAKGDGARDDDAQRLEERQARQQEASVARHELEEDGRVDGDVAANAEADKGREDEKGRVALRGAEAEAEHRRDQARQVECPSTAYTSSPSLWLEQEETSVMQGPLSG